MIKGDVARAGPPLTIGIPLLSQKVSPDWSKSCGLLEQALASIANQTVACERVLIACHERPVLKIPAGLDVEFIEVRFDYPRYSLDCATDQYRKKEEIGERHRRYGGGRLFFLDADDVIERNFVAAIARIEAKAIVLRRGYKLDCATDKVIVLPRFWRRCGSCAVVDWTRDELPEVAHAEAGSTLRDLLNVRHYNWPGFFEARGWPTAFVDEPLVMYVTNHGQNRSLIYSGISLKWALYNRVAPGARLGRTLRERFALAPEPVQ